MGVCGPPPKTLTLFMTKNLIPYLRPLRACGWHICPKCNLRRATVDGLNDNDEKVAPSKKHTQFETGMANIDTLFMTQKAEKPYPLGSHIPI